MGGYILITQQKEELSEKRILRTLLFHRNFIRQKKGKNLLKKFYFSEINIRGDYKERAFKIVNQNQLKKCMAGFWTFLEGKLSTSKW